MIHHTWYIRAVQDARPNEISKLQHQKNQDWYKHQNKSSTNSSSTVGFSSYQAEDWLVLVLRCSAYGNYKPINDHKIKTRKVEPLSKFGQSTIP
jgi:hypothetical protein